MAYNWRPVNPVYIDLETQATVNLKTVGSRVYLRHPHTRLLSLVAKCGNQILVWARKGRYPGNTLNLKPGDCWPKDVPRGPEVITLDDGDRIPEQLWEWIAVDKRVFLAHNAQGFDAEAYSLLVGGPQPDWCDSQPLCRAAGFPAGLDKLGKLLFGSGKDEGSAALKLMYTAKMKGDFPAYPVGTLPIWRSVLQYNVKDVLLLERVWDEVKTAGEPELLSVDSVINTRGISIDRRYIEALLELWDDLESDALAQIASLTDGALNVGNLRSPIKIKAWLREQGVKVDSINRQVLERLYEFPDEFFQDHDELTAHHAHICEVLQLRQSITRISKSKLRRILEIADSDDRVRDVLVAYGAHTGRWTGRNVQPHNLAKGLAKLNVEKLCRHFDAGTLTLEVVREALGET